jgi:hypothetical protein
MVDFSAATSVIAAVPLLKTYRLLTPNIQLKMSYDLWFWRQTKSSDLSLDQICDQLAEDNLIDGIAHLPIADIKAAVRAEFPGIEDELTSMTWEGNDSYFQVCWPVYATHVSVSCGYKLLDNPEPLNRLIDVMASFGCALYDPQTGERYTQPDLPKSDIDP